MKWFTNLSIKLKLLLSFGFITLIAAAIGLLGIFNLSTLREKDSLMYNNMTVPITYLADITNYYQRIRVNTRDLILAQSPQEEIEYENRIIDYRLKIAGLKDKFEKTILLDNVRNSFSRFKEKFEQYNSGVDKLILLVKQNQNSTAIALLRGEMYKTAKEAQEELDKLIQQKNQNAGATYLSNDSLSKTSSLVMSILLALGVLSALTLSFYVSKLISSGIKEISGRIDSLKTICL
ncbi:MAG: MCP four helix bundle domain-containing protein, partial [Bacillota bacterium]